MSQHIGNAGGKAKAWVEHLMLSSSHLFKKAEELEEFSERFSSLFGLGVSLDMTTRKRMETFLGHDFEKVRLHCNSTVEEASHHLNARAFTFGEHIYVPQYNLNISTAQGLGLLAHELTHVVQQTRPQKLPQDGAANHKYSSEPSAQSNIGPNARMAFLAPTGPATSSPHLGEAQAQTSEQLMTKALADTKPQSPPEINHLEIADKVYHLMQNDLVLERERATKVGV
jgi:hypothetical protein